MKKQLIIFLLFSLQLSAQNAKFPKVKISEPCTQEFVDNYKGKWLIPDVLINNPNKDFSQGAMTRLREIQKLIVGIYPRPMGADAYWSAGYSTNYFAEKVKYIKEDGRTRTETVSANPVKGWRYSLVLHPWYCDNENKNQIMNGYPDMGDGAGLKISADNTDAIVSGMNMEDDIWTINGQEIKFRMTVIGKWKGFDMMSLPGGAAAESTRDRFVLISRNGILPYIPVTRKQFLEKGIAYVNKTYDEWIALTDNDPDKDQAAVNKKRNINDKTAILRKYREAMEESTIKGLLDSPAIIQGLVLFESDGLIFSSEAEGGRMLVIDNPAYYRKDLPGYVPQLFVLEWSWGKLKSSTDFRTAIEQNFPIEQLQDLIDK